MHIKVIHLDLDPCGGAEYLALVTLKSLTKMGARVDLAVAKAPDISRIAKSFGENTYRILEEVHIRPLGPLPFELDKSSGKLTFSQGYKKDFHDYDAIINTHADILPFFLPNLKHYITYCHFPAAAVYMKSHDETYLDNLLDAGLLDKRMVNNNSANKHSLWNNLLDYYHLMLKNSLIVTNSKFSQQAIINELKMDGQHQIVPVIISPPVRVDEIIKMVPFHSRREDIVLVLSRIHPSKKIENAIEVARILKRRGVGEKMLIVGNLTTDNICKAYKEEISNMIERYDLSDYVVMMPSIDVDSLRRLMQKSKVYLHPMRGEPFGISVVEAMAAGIIPIVPSTGGVTEFVPKEYQFESLDEACNKIQAAMKASDTERQKLSEIAEEFSAEDYENQFAFFIKTVLSSMPQQRQLPHDKSSGLKLR